MSDISFKKFAAFVDSTEEVSDEQLSEIFGFFRNNSKLDKLKAEREKLKGLKAAKAAELDQALKNMGAGKKPGVMSISDKDISGALGADDRKYLAKDDAYRDKKAKEIRLRLGMKESEDDAESFAAKYSAATPVEELKAHKKYLEDSIEENSDNPALVRSLKRALGRIEKFMIKAEAVVMAPLRKIKEPGWYVVDHMDKPVEGPMQEGAAKDRAEELSGKVTGDVPAFSAEYYSDYDIKRMNEHRVFESLFDLNQDVLQEHDDPESIVDELFSRASAEDRRALKGMTYAAVCELCEQLLKEVVAK